MTERDIVWAVIVIVAYIVGRSGGKQPVITLSVDLQAIETAIYRLGQQAPDLCRVERALASISRAIWAYTGKTDPVQEQRFVSSHLFGADILSGNPKTPKVYMSFDEKERDDATQQVEVKESR